jgi:hypothetical protein
MDHPTPLQAISFVYQPEAQYIAQYTNVNQTRGAGLYGKLEPLHEVDVVALQTESEAEASPKRFGELPTFLQPREFLNLIKLHDLPHLVVPILQNPNSSHSTACVASILRASLSLLLWIIKIELAPSSEAVG